MPKVNAKPLPRQPFEAHACEAGEGLGSAEWLLDELALPLAHRVARQPRRSRVDRRTICLGSHVQSVNRIGTLTRDRSAMLTPV